MAHSEIEKYYEADREKVPQISHSDFAVESIADPDAEDTQDIVKFLEEGEAIIKKLLESNDYKLNQKIANKIFDNVYNKFKHTHSPIIMFDEITAFFEFDYVKYFQLLQKQYKTILASSLKKNMNLDTFIRIKKREQIQQTKGSYQPCFNKHG